MATFLSNIAATLHRPRSGKRPYYPEVDGLRFVAIALVIISHIFIVWLQQPADAITRAATVTTWPAMLQFFLKRGDVGVVIFFVISAFIISRPFIVAAHSGQRLSLKNYYLRRLVRIEPPYLIITTGIFLLYALKSWANVQYFGPHYGASMFYLHNIVFARSYGLNDIAWSLEVEIQFYLLAPLLFPLFRQPAFKRRGLLMALAVAFFVLRHLWNPPFISLIQYAGFFVSGMLIADILTAGIRFSRTHLTVITLIGLASLFTILFGSFIPDHANGWVSQLAIPLFVFASLSDTILRRCLRLKWLAIIGGMCYSIYLIHNLLLVLLVKYGIMWQPLHTTTASFIANLVLLFGVTAIIGAIVYKLIEQPFMKLSARYPLEARGIGSAPPKVS